MKHTPGPWDYDGFVIRCGDGALLHCYDKPRPVIEREANARLIAAAPDLLAALEAVEWIEVPSVDDPWFNYHACPWCESVKAVGHMPDCPRQLALAKARGDEHD